MNNLEHLHRELRDAKAEIAALKNTIAKVAALVPDLVEVTATHGQPPEVANMVRRHNAALDDLILLVINDAYPQISIYGHDPEPSMAVDCSTLEIHDEY